MSDPVNEAVEYLDFVGADFVLKTRGDSRAEEMAGVFLKALPAIVLFRSRNAPPFIAKVMGPVHTEVDLKQRRSGR